MSTFWLIIHYTHYLLSQCVYINKDTDNKKDNKINGGYKVKF